MGCIPSSKIIDFYDYENGENITDSEYADIGEDISVMAINKEGKVCVRCNSSRQLWNIRCKMTDDIKLVLKDYCYECCCSHTWKYKTKDKLYFFEKIVGKVEGKLTEKEHSSPHFQCQGCKKYLHKIYDIAFDNQYRKRLRVSHVNSYCYSCLIRFIRKKLWNAFNEDSEW